jgi:hypothetical protein
MIDRRSLKSLSYACAGVSGGIALLYIPRLLPQIDGQGASLAEVGSVVLALAWTLYFALAGFRSAEEFARERSKFAWYWGSLIGIVTAVPVMALVALGGLPWLIAGRSEAHALGLGMMVMLGAQLIGFVVMSAWWRATKR